MLQEPPQGRVRGGPHSGTVRESVLYAGYASRNVVAVRRIGALGCPVVEDLVPVGVGVSAQREKTTP